MLATRNDQPFYNVGVNWSRVLGPSLINEVLVGYSKHDRHRRDLRLGGHRRRQRRCTGSRAASRSTGLSCITSAAGRARASTGSRRSGRSRPTPTPLAKTYQINEKLTWLRGRHAFKFGGQFLRYDQQRFYAGNNGLLGFISYNGAFTGSQFADFLLDQVAGKGRGGGDPTIPGRTSRTGSRSSSRTTSR